MIGRVLTSDDVVHHINGKKDDNRPENLRVVSTREHRQIHNDEIAAKLRRLAEYERRFGALDDEPREHGEGADHERIH